MATQKLSDEFQGDEVAQKMIQLSQILSATSSGADIDEEEVKLLEKK